MHHKGRLADVNVGLRKITFISQQSRLADGLALVVWLKHIIRHMANLRERLPTVVAAVGAFFAKQWL